MAPVTILSPHQDDAALSLSIAIRNWVAQGRKVTVLNCFTNSSYAPYAVTGDVRKLRADEDRAALPAEVQIENLGLEDAPIRLKCDAGRVCGLPWTAADYSALETISQHVQVIPLLLVPLAFFGHIDHQITSLAGSMSFGQVAFYEDLPYATRVDATEHHKCRMRTGRRLSQKILCGSLVEKERALLKYRSQLSTEDIQSVMAYTRNLGGERLWVSSGASHDC